MKKITFALMVAFSFVAGCASGGGAVVQRGSLLLRGDGARVFAAGPAVVHAFSMDRGGRVYLAAAKTGTDADCGTLGQDGSGSPAQVKVDQLNLVKVPAGEVACVATDKTGAYELLWHGWRVAPEAGQVLLAGSVR